MLGGEQFRAVGLRGILDFFGIEQVEARQLVILKAGDRQRLMAGFFPLKGPGPGSGRVGTAALGGVDDLGWRHVAQWQQRLWVILVGGLGGGGAGGGFAILAALLALAFALGEHRRLAHGHPPGFTAAGAPVVELAPAELIAGFGELHRGVAGEQDQRNQIGRAAQQQGAGAADDMG